LKYGGDRTLDAAAIYWGQIYLNLPVFGPEELLAQAETVPIANEPGEREFSAYMANYLASRFETLNRLAAPYHSADDPSRGAMCRSTRRICRPSCA